MTTRRILQDSIYSKKNLSPFFDSFIYSHLNALILDGVNEKELVLVFWDITKFSELCKELMKHHEIISFLLREYYDSSAKIIDEYDGILDKFIGDGIFAYFGYQVPDLSKASIDAVNAALKLKEKFREIKKNTLENLLSSYGKTSDVKIDLRCGIHIGKVLFGYWKSAFRSQITAIGNEVNFCSRLESFSKKDQIIVSTQLHNKIEHDFIMKRKRVSTDELKTYPEVRYVYEVIGIK